MANEPDNLVLEHLRIIRGQMNDMRGEMKDMRGDMDAKVQGLRDDIQGIRGEILGMRMDIHGIRKVQGEHSRSLESLEERFDMVREGTSRAINIAAGAADHSFSNEKQIHALANRVEKLEQSK